MLRLKGENVMLRSLQEDDVNELLRLERSLGNSDTTNKALSRSSLLKFIHSGEECLDIAYMRLAIVDKSERIIGSFDTFNPKKDSLEIAYIIYNRRDRRKGFCSEAYHLLEEFLREMFEIGELRAKVKEGNAPSLAFLLSLGFRQTGFRTGIRFLSKKTF